MPARAHCSSSWPPGAPPTTRGIYRVLKAGETVFDGIMRYLQRAGLKREEAALRPGPLTPRQQSVLDGALRARARYVPRP